jgi:SH3-like domain-containing protein
MKKIFLIVVLLVLSPGGSWAQAGADVPSVSAAAPEPAPATGLPIPRFVSLRSDKVFVRTGPALRYPIKWIYNKSELPVEIVQEFDTWRKIRDVDGDEGWVHQSLLSPKRSALVKAEEAINLNEKGDLTTPVIARLEPQVLALVSACDGQWCEIESGGYHGWAEQKFFWGVYAGERFN